MERLTDKNPCNSCNADRQIGNPNRWQCECSRCSKLPTWKNECIKKLKEYENAEEQGLLLKLQCKIGDEAYEIHPLTGKITTRKITNISIYNAPDLTIFYISGNYLILDENIGKTVFLKRDEAEEALRKMKESEE